MSNIFGLSLNEQQKAHLRGIRWLFGGARGTGRTTILAMYIIEQAMNSKRKEVKVADHYLGNSSGNLSLAGAIHHILGSVDDIDYQLRIIGGAISLKIKNAENYTVYCDEISWLLSKKSSALNARADLFLSKL